MRAVNLRSDEGLAEAETGRRKSSCPDQKDRSRPDKAIITGRWGLPQRRPFRKNTPTGRLGAWPGLLLLKDSP